MNHRNSNLQNLVDATQGVIQARATDYPEAMGMAEKIFAALSTPGAGGENAPTRLPVCGHLSSAYEQAHKGGTAIATLTDAFAAMEPELSWQQRVGAAGAPGDFDGNHANAILVGRGGLEVREDVLIGVSLLAPGTPYPRHQHPPEELYIVLSPGRWMQSDGPFAAKQSGDLVHNPPNVWHAMAADEVPLLAVWCLWTGA